MEPYELDFVLRAVEMNIVGASDAARSIIESIAAKVRDDAYAAEAERRLSDSNDRAVPFKRKSKRATRAKG
jgi:hypothetical protein